MKGLVQLVGLLTLTSVATGHSPKCPKADSHMPLFFADERDRSAFWQCGHGTAFHMHCDEQLVWNAELNVCDWPSSVEADDEDSDNPTVAASSSYKQEALIHIVEPIDIGDLEEMQEILSFESVIHETLPRYNLQGDGSSFHMGHAEGPVEDTKHPKAPVEDFRYTKSSVEEPRYTRRPVEDLEHATSSMEDFRHTRRLVEDLEYTTRFPEPLGHTKKPREYHVDHEQLMRSIFQLTE